MPLILDFTKLLRNRDASFPTRVSILMQAGNGFHVVIPKRELEIKIVYTAGFQDINSMYITKENPFYQPGIY